MTELQDRGRNCASCCAGPTRVHFPFMEDSHVCCARHVLFHLRELLNILDWSMQPTVDRLEARNGGLLVFHNKHNITITSPFESAFDNDATIPSFDPPPPCDNEPVTNDPGGKKVA